MTSTVRTNRPRKIKTSLALTIAIMISILLMALGISVTYYTYQNQKRTALETTEKFFAFSSRQTEDKLFAMIHSVQSFVTVSSALKSIDLSEGKDLSGLLPYFQQSFSALPWMTSFYVGYQSGAFYMIQALRQNKLIRKAFSAPDQAMYVVKTIPPGQGKTSQIQYQFYDKNLIILEKRTETGNRYDPRNRYWYSQAMTSGEIVITRPYTFFTSRQPGITIAHSLKKGEGVVGADTILSSISQLLHRQKLTPSTQIVIMEKNGNFLFSSDQKDLQQYARLKAADEMAEINVKDLHNQAANVVRKSLIVNGIKGGTLLQINGRTWFGHARQLVKSKNKDIFLTIASPLDELMVNARATRRRNVLIIFSVIIVAVSLGLYLSHRIAYSLHNLSVQAENIRDFQFSNPFTIQSRISEVDELADTMTVMQSAINRFIEIARALSAEKHMERVLEMIVNEAQSITGADGGGIGLVSDDGKKFSYVLIHNRETEVHLGGTSDKEIDLPPLLLSDSRTQNTLELSIIDDTETRTIDDIRGKEKEFYATIQHLHEKEAYRCQSLLIIPLLNRQDEVIGLLHLVNARENVTGKIVPFAEHKTAYVKALSSNAALALDNNRLIRAQKELFDSFVRLIAGAIDTKSPYTGGHCQRVPVIAEMLADAASAAATAPFATFTLSDDERYELFVASWLHDCGKVTTPEYVVDKATKLETNYNRIHEIRTRFEVLWRDADITYYQGIAKSSANKHPLQKEREQKKDQLQADFAFLAKCNEGGEFMTSEQVERLKIIGSQIWERNFDHRLGISGDEKARLDMAAEVSFPVCETLLADKDEHILPHLGNGNIAKDNPWKFKMAMPDHRYNLGELYNLSIAKGTLTREERYKINDHIVQTIIMLNNLPFPKEIRRVPEWAGNHHEKLDGSGYPRCLTGKQLSIPERIMAIADIFEALTAADRPYKTPKTLSECITIMNYMKKDGHICPNIFELLLTSGIYKEYAQKYMHPEQIDAVDITTYLS